MYLVIHEDNDVTKVTDIDQPLQEAWDEGIIDIIDITNPEIPLMKMQESWEPVEDE